MTFTTKYEKGQKIWLMDGDGVKAKPIETKIMGISIYLDQYGKTTLSYILNTEVFTHKRTSDFDESYLFATKQELLDSL